MSQVLKVKEKNGVVTERQPKRKKAKDPEASARKKRRLDASDEASSSEPSSSTKTSLKKKPTTTTKDTDSTEDSPAPAPSSDSDPEILGMLIEAMATSRASSVPISQLYKSVIASRPSLKSQKSEREWISEFEWVLERESEGSGVFGKVESSGKDSSDKPLPPHYFYVPERDLDQERASLIKSMMPRPGKRSTTKKYKQYYYQPLAKITRWDSEDAI
ncbi:hypothetical protein C8J56DRAFT_787003 [Mycena floridula]|nr:hypothetical protein C8J56DRAFT_787003 [Mycena floridula]